MTVEDVEIVAQLLSVLPVFDDAIARDVVNLAREHQVAGEDLDVLRVIHLTGLLKKERSCWRVDESMRSILRDRLMERDAQGFRRVARVFIRRAAEGSADALNLALGTKAARLSIIAMTMALEEGSEASFSELLDSTRRGNSRGRLSDMDIAINLIGEHPAYDKRDRQMVFLEGFRDWRLGKRSASKERFERVLAKPAQDSIDGIASHLVAVELMATDLLEDAYPFLVRSVADLRAIGDGRGLVMVLTSLGIAERELASRGAARADARLGTIDFQTESQLAAQRFQSAIETLNEAIELGRKPGYPIGVTLLELATCYSRLGAVELALQSCEQAAQEIRHGDSSYLRLLTLLGSLYRQNEEFDRATAALDTAATVAIDDEVSSFELARLLNVTASNERRIGEYVSAARHARKSVELGRSMGNRRHLAQALHTLGAVLIDLAGAQWELDEAESLLSEARDLLVAQSDVRGVSMVDRTMRVLRGRRRELTDGEGKVVEHPDVELPFDDG